MDLLERLDESCGGGEGSTGGLFGLPNLLTGSGGALAGLGEGSLELAEPGGSDFAVGHFCWVAAGGGEDGVGKAEVLGLVLVEVATGA